MGHRETSFLCNQTRSATSRTAGPMKRDSVRRTSGLVQVLFREVGNCVGASCRLRTRSRPTRELHCGEHAWAGAADTRSRRSSSLRTARLLRWLVACGRLVQLLLQLQQLAQLLNIGGVGCWNAPRTWLHGTLIR